ncbi:MAG: tetratricopeptide repeat protein [Xanthobacteraceae bacterium]
MRGWHDSGAAESRQTMPLSDLLVRAEQYRVAGRLPEAAATCRTILSTEPAEPNATHLLGLIAHQSGKPGEAIEHLRRAVKLAPDAALYHANLGEMCRLAGRLDEAVRHGRRAVKLEPDYPEALSNLGAALYERKAYIEAADCHRRAIALNPGFAQAHSNLGNALYAMKRFDEAVDAYRRAIAIEPGFADAWSNLGTSLHHSGQLEDGLVALRRAVALAPDHANAHSGLGILLLMRGDFAEGLDEYEWRLRSRERKGRRFPEQPWQGESLAGRHIYVEAEQGLGDTLQFARYLPLLARRGAAVSVRVHEQLTALMRESLPGIEVLGDRGEPSRAVDCDCALLSLPKLLRTRLETIPAAVPYLRVPQEAMARRRQQLAAMRGLKVGLVWAGNPEHANDLRRSLDLAALAPLLAAPSVSFASLQVGPRAADLRKSRAAANVLDLSAGLTDFVETAAAIEQLDLIITVDTSVAHLAGALGKPTWLLLPWVTDWRWLLGREDSPWYPTMRLFRQRRDQPWAEIVVRVAAELAAAAGSDAARLVPFRAEGERRAAQAAEIIAIEAMRAAPLPQPTATDHAPSPAAMNPAPVGGASRSPRQSLSAAQVLMLAEQQRRAGYVAQAEELCRSALAAEPDNAEALHLLGIVAHQSGKLGEAIEHVGRAARLAPDVPLYLANLGEMCRLAGRIDEAITHGRRAVALKPDYPEALSNLGIAYYDRGQYGEAIGCYDRALALRPDYVEAHSNRGNALRALKRLVEAEAAYRRAIELRPQFAAGWNNLGTTLRDLKRPEEAERAYRTALAEMPNDPETLDNLALALKDLDRLDEAAELLRRALAIEARSEKFHVHYASVLIEQKNVDAAAAAAEGAVALNPDSHDAINLLGRVAFERGALETAITHYRRALQLEPDLADAYNNMGNVLKELGHLADARAAFLRAIELDPTLSGVYVNLADSTTFSADDPHLAAMQALAAQQDGLSATDRMHLDFALAKAFADLGEHRRSFEHLLSGNARKRAMMQYDEAAAMALFDRIEATFTAELIAAKSGLGDPSDVPIFVLGMPRSGTTLVEQILASHAHVHGAGELRTFNEVVDTVRGPDGAVLPFPEFVGALDAAPIRAIGASYLAQIRKLAPASPHITDKMPSNYYFVGLIHLALPNARIIHTVRDPVDTCISCFSKLFTAEQNHTYDLAELGRYFRRYQKLMAHWRRVLPTGRILDVRYEDVVADLEGQARHIIAHCGLEWDPRCLAFHATERPVRTASATQVRRPIYRSAIGRWRLYEEFLGALLKELPEVTASAAPQRHQ